MICFYISKFKVLLYKVISFIIMKIFHKIKFTMIFKIIKIK